MIGQSHDYKRNGTTTRFAARDVATGAVTGQHFQRRRRIEFLAVMNRALAQHPGRRDLVQRQPSIMAPQVKLDVGDKH